MVDVFAAPDSVQNFNFLIQAIRWDQDRNWLADNLFGRIPEKALRCLVPGGNRTVEVFPEIAVSLDSTIAVDGTMGFSQPVPDIPSLEQFSLLRAD